MSEFLHIVCLDSPEPPTYGGAIDMYSKIEALAKSGTKIILHYFNYRQDRELKTLRRICVEVHAYSRNPPLLSLLSAKPYIVSSRINKKLVARLSEDNYPILFEGIHCTGVITHLSPGRKLFIRMHNDESAYYQRLSETERSLFKKIYYLTEAARLKKYLNRLSGRDLQYLCLSKTDIEIFRSRYNLRNLRFLPCFISWQSITSEPGRGSYTLYHGNMLVAENQAAAQWLLGEVFAETDFAFVIAGNDIPDHLKKKAAASKNIRVVNNPSVAQLEELIGNAQIHMLPSMNQTGVKLKLLHALTGGRHCITNRQGVIGSGLEELVHIAETALQTQQLVRTLYNQPFTEEEKERRQQIFGIYNNSKNAEAINELL